jgi:rhodanese-related sulfurtransferase
VTFWREAAAIVVLAFAAAAISNATAGRERKLAWLGMPPTAAAAERTAPAPGSAAAPVTGPSAAPRPLAGPSSGNPAPAARPPEISASPAGIAPHPALPFVEITSAQAKALFDGGAVFIDARRSAAYREGHVRGSRSISVWESDADAKVKAFYDEGHDANAPLVVYCSGGDCEDSHELARKLWGVTFDNVCVYRDGFPDWEKRGWPVSRGDAP